MKDVTTVFNNFSYSYCDVTDVIRSVLVSLIDRSPSPCYKNTNKVQFTIDDGRLRHCSCVLNVTLSFFPNPERVPSLPYCYRLEANPSVTDLTSRIERFNWLSDQWGFVTYAVSKFKRCTIRSRLWVTFEQLNPYNFVKFQIITNPI
jgi:hypothetical protein